MKFNNELEQNDLYKSVAKSYHEILPQNQEALLLVVWLYKKIQDGKIEHEFSKRDFEDTLDDVLELLQKPQSLQKETLSKKISNYYYRTISYKNEYRLHLTVFAETLCKLIIEQVQPEIKKLELIHTFRTTLKLTADDLESIEKLEYWHEVNFNSAKKQILFHIEFLQKTVEDKTNELRQLLKPDADDPKALVNDFIAVFETLKEQTTGLLNTINFKNETLQKIQSVKEKFSETEEVFEKYGHIQRDFENFFENIDRRIASINEKIQLASKRLRNLIDTLKYKQKFKVNLEKLLNYMLKTARHEQGQIVLDEKIPSRRILSAPTRLISIPFIDFKADNQIKPEIPAQDPAHLEQERQKNLQMLKNQEQTAKWMDKMEQSLEKGETVNYTDWFNKIAKTENNLEVPIKVCFGIIESCNNSDTKHISLEQEHEKTIDKNVTLWKMTIRHTDS